MIGIEACQGVFFGVSDLPENAVAMEQAVAKRELAPVSVYAIKAMTHLTSAWTEMGMICVTGPSGSTVKAFDAAWRAASDGKLTGHSFSRRSKRIHPFTLIRSLQNQPAAALSINFGIVGPCLNFLEEDIAVSSVLDLAVQMLLDVPRLVLVLAAAGGRDEEVAKRQALGIENTVMEGAAVFLLGKEGRLGALQKDSCVKAIPEANQVPLLDLGLTLLKGVQEKRKTHIFLAEPFHHFTYVPPGENL